MLGRLVVAGTGQGLDQAIRDACKTPIEDPSKFNLVEKVSTKVREFTRHYDLCNLVQKAVTFIKTDLTYVCFLFFL